MNRERVLGYEDAASVADIQDAAEELHLRMQSAPADAARRLPGAPSVGGVRRPGGPSSPRAAVAGESLATLLGSLVEAVRAGVESYNTVIRVRFRCYCYANRVLERSSCACVGR